MDTEKIAEKARKSISRYCIEECKAYCCRKGYLNLKPDQVNIITQGRRKELEEKKILHKINENNYSLYLGNHDMSCPSLNDDFTCRIHKDKNRPLACRQFPLFLEGKTIRLSSRCPAVKEGRLYPYVYKLTARGYKEAESNSYSDFDFVNTMKIFERKDKIKLKREKAKA